MLHDLWALRASDTNSIVLKLLIAITVMKAYVDDFCFPGRSVPEAYLRRSRRLPTEEPLVLDRGAMTISWIFQRQNASRFHPASLLLELIEIVKFSSILVVVGYPSNIKKYNIV